MTKEEILDIMKTEKDLYELNINGFDCIIYRFRGHLNGYVSLLKEGYDDLYTSELEVHGGITYEGNIKDLMIQGLTKDYGDNKIIGFDTAHAGDAFICEGFEYTLSSGIYRDYNYVYNELVILTNQLKNKSGLKLKDSEIYLNRFIDEVKDYTKLSNIDFYIKHVVGISENNDIQEQYNNYKVSYEDDEEDMLTYEEWLEEVFYEENQDDIDEAISEYKDPLEIQTYKTEDGGYSIYEITLTWGGPNIYLTLNSRWNKATYEFYWGGDNLKEDLSYLYDDINSYFSYITEQ